MWYGPTHLFQALDEAVRWHNEIDMPIKRHATAQPQVVAELGFQFVKSASSAVTRPGWQIPGVHPRCAEFSLIKVPENMTTKHQLAVAVVSFFFSAAGQAFAVGPSAVDFKNYTKDVVTVYVAARAGNGVEANEIREINGPFQVKPGETQSMFKNENADLEHLAVCVMCDGRPQWNPPETKSIILSQNELEQRGDGSYFVKLPGGDDSMVGMKFTNKILPDAMLKGAEFRFVHTSHKGRGTKVIHYNR